MLPVAAARPGVTLVGRGRAAGPDAAEWSFVMATFSAPRGAYLVWSAGLLAYTVAVLQRSSFGVAGLDAAERFDASPTVLAGFLVLQLLVYAALQVPVGLLLDRFGARAMVLAGAVTMTAAQVLVALATALPLAIAARVLVGIGDALTFISVLSVVSVWFPARRVPLMTQLTALLGQSGQVLSAIPLATLLLMREEEANELQEADRHGTAVPDRVAFSLTGRLVAWLEVNEVPLWLDRYGEVLDHLTATERDVLLKHRVDMCLPLR